MLSTRLLQDREGNKIREFNEICLSYFTYAAILCKKVFSYLVILNSYRIVITYQAKMLEVSQKLPWDCSIKK